MCLTWRYWRSNTSNLYTRNTFVVNFSSPPTDFSPRKTRQATSDPVHAPMQSHPCGCKCPYGSSNSSSSSASGRERELLLGTGQTDVVRRRISQQQAKLCRVPQKNGRLGVFYSAWKEECFVSEQNMTFLLDLSQSVIKSAADVSIWPAATGFHPWDSRFMTELLRLVANSWNFFNMDILQIDFTTWIWTHLFALPHTSPVRLNAFSPLQFVFVFWSKSRPQVFVSTERNKCNKKAPHKVKQY